MEHFDAKPITRPDINGKRRLRINFVRIEQQSEQNLCRIREKALWGGIRIDKILHIQMRTKTLIQFNDDHLSQEKRIVHLHAACSLSARTFVGPNRSSQHVILRWGQTCKFKMCSWKFITGPTHQQKRDTLGCSLEDMPFRVTALELGQKERLARAKELAFN